MIRQTVVWTLLPDPGAAAGNRLSLLASPRLGNDESATLPLSKYPDLARWPELLTGVSVEIVGPGNSVVVPATFVDEPPDPALWSKVFPPDLPVVPFRFDADPTRPVARTPLRSYPVRLLHDSIADTYRSALADGGADHSRQAAATVPGWGPVDRLVDLVHQPAWAAHPSGPGQHAAAPETPLPDALPADPAGWARFHAFHSPPVDAPEPGAAPGTPPRPDFHAVYASLANHPRLLERLGLVRTITVTLPSGLGGAVTIRAVPRHGGQLTPYRPRTRCVVQAGRLRLATRTGQQAPLHVPLDDPDVFETFDVDTDAAGMALRSYTANLAGLDRAAQPPPLRLPALRSDGIHVAEADRQIHLHQDLRRAAEVLDADLTAGADGGDVVLTTEDVAQGLRIDVFDDASRRWYPLCRRKGVYRIRGTATPIPFDDEGSVTEAVTDADDGQVRTRLLHQSVFRWNGWSLVVPPPGGLLDLDGTMVVPSPTPDPASGVAFVLDASVPAGTLPSLRYGRGYRFRARLVDVAGRSVGFDPAPDAAAPATPVRRYHRYEPVPAPVLVPRRPVGEGESATVLVIRTDNTTGAAAGPGPTCERHLLAPKAAVNTLERHGVLDVAGQHRLDPATYRLLFDRDRGTVTGRPDPGALSTAYVDTDTMDLPWLPDPLARGVTIRGLATGPEVRLDWPSGGGWPDQRPVRLVLAAGTSIAATVDPASRVIRVTLPPGVSLRAALSSHLHPGDQELLGLWNWFAETAGRSTAEIQERRADAVVGSLAALTPATEIRLVHAVRCPLQPPTFGNPRIVRVRDETTYRFTDDTLTVHPGSTVSVHVEAAWSDTVDDPATDDPAAPGPRTAPGRTLLELDADARQAQWDENTVDPEVAFRARGHLPDTRARRVTFTPVAVSRYAAYFAQRLVVRLTGVAKTVVARDGFVPGSVSVRSVPRAGLDPAAAPAPVTTFSLDRDVLVDEVTGAVARRADGAVPDGSEVEVTFVRPPVTRRGAPLELLVPATARPAPPVVHSVVPAYRWSRSRSGTTVTNVRRGGLLRIFLARPWGDSGVGEMLAVLVADRQLFPPVMSAAETKAWNRAVALASDWADDPTGLNPATAGTRLARGDLTGARRDLRVGMPLDQDLLLRAMGHPVEFDSQRGLWFADVAVGDNAYRPFVKLTVARLQPSVVSDDLAVSQPVTVGFHEVAPDRTSTIELRAREAVVTVSGPMTASATFTVSVQRRVDGDPVLWQNLSQLPEVSLVRDPAASRVSGVVPLPAPPGDRSTRLLIREYQVLPAGYPEPQRRISYFDSVDV